MYIYTIYISTLVMGIGQEVSGQNAEGRSVAVRSGAKCAAVDAVRRIVVMLLVLVQMWAAAAVLAAEASQQVAAATAAVVYPSHIHAAFAQRAQRRGERRQGRGESV